MEVTHDFQTLEFKHACILQKHPELSIHYDNFTQRKFGIRKK